MKITIYSTQTCGYCKMLKKYLDEHHFIYEEKMADENEAYAQELYEKSKGFAVPYTIIEKDDSSTTDILGFDIPKFNATLGIA